MPYETHLPAGAHYPYPSQRMPVLAGNVVATSQPLAAQAGLRMLLSGGNAVDAILAAAMTLTVVEPCSNGIGSDAFALVWDGAKLHGLNASGRAPQAWTPQRFAHLPKMPANGWDSVTVPGCVSAWAALAQRFGKLPLEQPDNLALGRYLAGQHGFELARGVKIQQSAAHPAAQLPDGADQIPARGTGKLSRLRHAVAALAGRLDRPVEGERHDQGLGSRRVSARILRSP